MSVEKTLFLILQQELGEKENGVSVLENMDHDTYSAILALSKKHSISQIVASACAKASSSEIISHDMAQHNKEVMTAFYQSQQRKYVLNEIVKCFDAAKILNIPLKGSVICDYYPEPWMRSSCDVDILIKNEDSERAIACLSKLGYTYQKSTSIHDHSLFSPTGVHVELHYTLIQEDCLESANKFLETVWEYTSGEGSSSYCKKLTNEMFILYHIAHMAKHFINGGCGIKPFIDLWIIREKMKYEAHTLDQMLIEAKMLEFYNVVQDVVDVWFENKDHSRVTQGIEEYIFKGGVYGTLSNVAAISEAAGEGKMKYLLKLMFMPRESLEIMYPRLERYPILFPYYQVKRWFRIFKKDKRDKIKNLTDIRNSVSNEEVTATVQLLDSLGLSKQV